MGPKPAVGTCSPGAVGVKKGGMSCGRGRRPIASARATSMPDGLSVPGPPPAARSYRSEKRGSAAAGEIVPSCRKWRGGKASMDLSTEPTTTRAMSDATGFGAKADPTTTTSAACLKGTRLPGTRTLRDGSSSQWLSTSWMACGGSMGADSPGTSS